MNISTLKDNLNNREILKSIGFEIDSESDGHLRGICPIHKGDNRSAFIFKEEGKLWYCHTHCKRGGDIINLVMEVNQIGFGEAVNYVCRISGIDPTSLTIDKKTQNKYDNFEVWLKALNKEKSDVPEYSILAEGEVQLKSFKQFGVDVCSYFDLRYAEKVHIEEKITHNKIIFPIKQNGKVVGATLRAVSKDDQVKWLNIPTGLKKKQLLYNLDNLRLNEPVILVEGPGDVLAVHNANLSNVAATLGSLISEEQLDALMPITTELIFMYDGDEAGQLGMQTSVKMAKNLFDCYVCVLKRDEDPGGLNSEQIMSYYNSRKKG